MLLITITHYHWYCSNRFTGRQVGTPGTAGAYFEVIVGPGVSGLKLTSTLTCTVHGSQMQEPGTISFASGAAGQSGDGMQADVTVTAGVVSDVKLQHKELELQSWRRSSN